MNSLSYAPTEDLRGPSGGAQLLEIRNLHVEFEIRAGTVNAVNGVTFDVKEGQTTVILGESGCGKSISAQAVIGTIPEANSLITGSVRYEGRELLSMPDKDRRKLRAEELGMVFQNASLNPCFSVGWQIAELFRIHRGMSRRSSKEQAVELLSRVGIPAAKSRVDDFPHQFSGGMRQRVSIAMAIALQPRLLIADEPTTALDVTVQAQIMELLARLQDEHGMGLLLITHDLGVAADVADRVVVMYAGRVAETGSVYDIFDDPRHPYTLGLMRSVPKAEDKGRMLTPISGSPPELSQLAEGCAFAPRCFLATDICLTETPPDVVLGPGRKTACHHRDEVSSGR